MGSGLLATAAPMVTGGQSEVDLAAGTIVVVVDVVVLVRITTWGIPTINPCLGVIQLSLNQRASLKHFDLRTYSSMMMLQFLMNILTENVVDRDGDEPALSQNELLTVISAWQINPMTRLSVWRSPFRMTHVKTKVLIYLSLILILILNKELRTALTSTTPFLTPIFPGRVRESSLNVRTLLCNKQPRIAKVIELAPSTVFPNSYSPDIAVISEYGDSEDTAVSQTSTDLVSNQRIQLPSHDVLDSSPSPLSNTVAESDWGYE